MNAVRSASDPGFWITYAVLQGVFLLAIVRSLDRYSRHPLAVVVGAAVWGATGAAFLALLGNGAVRDHLSTALAPFSDAISPPIVEEVAKALAIVAIVGPVRWLARRFGASVFDGVSSGIIYGVAVGVGFAFTEDAVYLLRGASRSGAAIGLETFVYRRDVLTVLHHSMYTAAFGAAVGLAIWSRRRWAHWVLPVAGLATAMAMHAANNGLVDVLLIRRYGRASAATWRMSGAGPPDVEATIRSGLRVVQVLDYAYVVAFLAALALWLRYQRRAVREELAEEVQNGLVDDGDVRRALRLWPDRRAGEWRAVSRARRELIDLGMLKWRRRRFGGDWEAVAAARRRVAAAGVDHLSSGAVPLPADRLVGRHADITAISALLREPGTPIVTLTGPGGTGKSRLAMEVGTRVAERFGSGTAFVALAAVDQRDGIVSAIAQSLDVRPIAGQTPERALAEWLTDRHLLLILDNFEQVAQHADLVAELAQAAPRVRFLVTTRVALRVAGEREYAVGSLPIADAVELFVDRARRRAPSIDLDAPGERVRVEELCARLDGLPLAVELGAAQLRAFGTGDLLARLDRRLDLPIPGDRDRPARQQTLGQAVGWSYDLLNEVEREVFAQLSVFVGGWTLLAAERVVVGGDHAAAALGALVDASLVVVDGGSAGATRYRMLETIRAYAVDRLDESNGATAARGRHAEFVTDLASGARHGLAGPDQLEWIHRLTADHENIRAGVNWLLTQGRNDEAMRAVVGLGPYWEQRGDLAEPRRWLEMTAGNSAPSILGAEALLALGRITLLQGDYVLAASRLEECGAAADALGASGVGIAARYERAFLALVAGRYGDAVELAAAGLHAAVDHADEQQVARGHHVLGRASAEGGDIGRADTELRAALAIRQERGDRRGIANSLSNLGRARLLAGDADEAATLIEQGLGIARELGDALRVAEALHFLGCVAIVGGDFRRASVLHAERLWLSRRLGEAIGIAESLDALGCGAQAGGDSRRAATLAGAADRIRESLGIVLWPLERSYCEHAAREARSALGSADFDAAWRHGRQMTVDEACSYAVEV